MAKVFLDANAFIDVVQGRGDLTITQSLAPQKTYISPLSTHILCYVEHIRIPSSALKRVLSHVEIVDFSKDILDKSLQGPTTDLEDNIQLHSAAEADCDVFLTSDRKLLALGYFGKTKISDHL